MKTLALFLIYGGILVMFLTFVYFLVYFIRQAGRTKIRVVVFSKDKKRKVHKFKNLESTFNIGKDKYEFDSDSVYRNRNKDFIYYNQGQSKPINMKDGTSGNIDSASFKAIVENNLIKQLFSTKADEYLSPQMMITYVILALVALLLIISLVKGNGAVSILGDANKEFIKQAVVEAIK